MCNHTYTVSRFVEGVEWTYRCRCPELYARARGIPWAVPDDPRFELRIDASGACIFHSRDLEWKRENDLPQRFLELLELLDRVREKCFDFREFVFVGTELREKPVGHEYVLRYQNLVIPEQADFFAATFIDTLELDSAKIKVQADFTQAAFLRDLIVTNSFVNSMSLNGATLQGRCFMQDVDFRQDTHFHRARFTGTSDGFLVRFETVAFRGIADFSDASFEFGPESGVMFQFVAFHDTANFRNTKFRCHVKFNNVGFRTTGEFIGTSFTGIQPFHTHGVPLPHNRGAVHFTDINVGLGGVLTFMGTARGASFFEHDVEIRLWDEFEGLVRFENVNFNRLRDECRKELLRLEKDGRVEIGPGCIKYRFQTGIRTVFIGRGNAPLVLEICQTFTSYFTASNGLNLGFEIVERDAAKVSFFYFTDEDITEVVFLDRLARAERELWNLLSSNPHDLAHAVSEERSTALRAAASETLINTVDGISALIGTLFRAGVRIAAGRWSEQDTRALLAAIRFNDDAGDDRARGLHRALVERYTGQTLFGFNHHQNRLLPPMTEPAAPSGAPAKLTILFLGANSSQSPLELDQEVRKIQDNLKMARERENLVLKQEWAVTVDALLQAMLDESPAIVHFSGHGNETGIILDDGASSPREVPVAALSELFRLFSDTVRCVILNACYSEHQARAIRQHIPYVIGMRGTVDDGAAIAFSTGFYKAIGAGRDVPFAFDMGQVCIRLEGFEGEAMPILM